MQAIQSWPRSGWTTIPPKVLTIAVDAEGASGTGNLPDHSQPAGSGTTVSSGGAGDRMTGIVPVTSGTPVLAVYVGTFGVPSANNSSVIQPGWPDGSRGGFGKEIEFVTDPKLGTFGGNGGGSSSVRQWAQKVGAGSPTRLLTAGGGGGGGGSMYYNDSLDKYRLIRLGGNGGAAGTADGGPSNVPPGIGRSRKALNGSPGIGNGGHIGKVRTKGTDIGDRGGKGGKSNGHPPYAGAGGGGGGGGCVGGGGGSGGQNSAKEQPGSGGGGAGGLTCWDPRVTAPLFPVPTGSAYIAISAVAVTTGSLPDGTVGASYYAKLQSAGQTGTTTWKLAANSPPLPDGLVLNPTAGTISGVPTTESTTNNSDPIVLQVTDSNGASSISDPLQIQVAPAVVTPTPLPTSATPTSTPTPVPSPTVTPVANPLTATWDVTSHWASGACMAMVVTNHTTTPISAWSASFQLPLGAAITADWNAGAPRRQTNQTVTVTPSPETARVAGNGSTTSYGFCYAGSANLPNNPTVTKG